MSVTFLFAFGLFILICSFSISLSLSLSLSLYFLNVSLSLFKLGIVKEHELWSCVIYAPLRPAENVPLVSRRPQSVLRCDAYSVVVPFAAHFALSLFGAAAKGKQVDYVAPSTHSVWNLNLKNPQRQYITQHHQLNCPAEVTFPQPFFFFFFLVLQYM